MTAKFEKFEVGQVVFVGERMAHVVEIEPLHEGADDVTFRLQNGAELTMLITSPILAIWDA